MKPRPKYLMSDDENFYPTVSEGCLTENDLVTRLESIVDNLNDKDTKKAKSTALELIEGLGVLDIKIESYETKISDLRVLVEHAVRYMGLNDYRSRIPQSTAKHFREVMGSMNRIVGANKYDRES